MGEGERRLRALLENIPREDYSRMKRISLSWKRVELRGEDLLCPLVEIEFEKR